MPRKARLYLPGGLFHVLGRGLERRSIFLDSRDKRDFLDRFGEGLYKTGHQCYAWVLMDNHYHLLLRQSEAPLSALMGPLLGGYALSFNRRHRRSGYLYQGRCRSTLCEEDSYFQELLRYIHLNPVRAKMVADVDALLVYPWTGHSVLMGKLACEWQTVDEVLTLFGTKIQQARKNYGSFLAQGLGVQSEHNLDGGGLVRSAGGRAAAIRINQEKNPRLSDERILGSSEFVATVLRQLELNNVHREDWTYDLMVNAVCDHFSVDQQQIKYRARGNARSKARALIATFAHDYLGMNTKELGASLMMTHQSVSTAIRRGRSISIEEGITLESLKP